MVNEAKRAAARLRAGVSTRGVEVPALEDPATALTNRTSERTTALIADLLEECDGTAADLAAVLEGLLLTAAFNLWANALEEARDPPAFRRAFAKLAGNAAEEVLQSLDPEQQKGPAV